MKARTLLLGAAAAAAVYLYRSRQQPDHTPAAGGHSTARRVVTQVEDKGRYAPFPFGLVLPAAARVVGRRMDR